MQTDDVHDGAAAASEHERQIAVASNQMVASRDAVAKLKLAVQP
jgi:hypothetical protein